MFYVLVLKTDGLETSWPSWAILGPSWDHLGSMLRPSGAIFGPSWGHLGAILGHLGAIFGHLGAILDYLGQSIRKLEL